MLLARVALCGVIPLKKYNAGFAALRGSRHEQSQIARVLLCGKSFSFFSEFVDRRTTLPSLLVMMVIIFGPIPLSGQIAGIYRVNTKQSQIEIHLFKGGFLSALGENHLIALTHFSGTADLSPASPWKADLSGLAASLKVIDPWGDSAERKEVQQTMLGPDQLDVSHYPRIELHSLSFDPTGQETTWHLMADIKLHGVTRKERFSLDCHQVGDQLRISGKKMLKLTDFNIQPFSKAFGAVKVKNGFEVTYNIVLDRTH